MKRFKDSISFAALLNLLLPGLGHSYWRDYTFGLFIFLILLVAATLFFVSFLVTLPVLVKIILFGLPTMFYIFSFFDLARTLRRHGGISGRSTRGAIIFMAIGLCYQLLAPTAPLNFVIRNSPEVYRIANNRLSPLYRQGDLVMANRLAYTADLFFPNADILHSLPRLGDIVCFMDKHTVQRTGLVIGLPGDDVEVINGVLIINGSLETVPVVDRLLLHGDMPLTFVDRVSILAVTLNLGAVDEVYQVPLDGRIGRVHRLF